MPPKHPAKHGLLRRCGDEARKPSNWIKGGVGVLVLTLVLTWLVPKLLDASWGRLCTLKAEADQVPKLAEAVTNLQIQIEQDSRLKWQIYNLSNQVQDLKNERLNKIKP